jgi:hypothetical protein
MLDYVLLNLNMSQKDGFKLMKLYETTQKFIDVFMEKLAMPLAKNLGKKMISDFVFVLEG